VAVDPLAVRLFLQRALFLTRSECRKKLEARDAAIAARDRIIERQNRDLEWCARHIRTLEEICERLSKVCEDAIDLNRRMGSTIASGHGKEVGQETQASTTLDE
jgi:hypothetical protein